MSLTVAADINDTLGDPHAQRATRDYHLLCGTITWDSAYPTGGESTSVISNAFPNAIKSLQLDSTDGYNFEYDRATDTVKAFNFVKALPPVMVYEETVTAVANVITLTYNAAHIFYISNDTKAYIIVDKGTTPGAGECAVDFTTATGTTLLTFAAADSNPTALVTYWPADSNTLLAANLVESDLVDASAATGHASIAGEVITLTGGACAIITVDVDGTAFKPIIDDDTAATTEYELNVDSSGDTVLTGYSTEFSAASVIKITWIKLPTGWSVTEDASAHSSDVVTILSHFYIPFNSCYHGNDDNDVSQVIRNSSETLSAGEIKVTMRLLAGVKITYHGDTDVAASGFNYMQLRPDEIGSFAGYTTAEVANGTNLSSLVANFTAVGF